MSKTPKIIVQIVHIHGPLRGQIQEFSQEVISFGRATENDVTYPKDAMTLSRKHAEIVREGNRFLFRNLGKNGSQINGKEITETYLKQGDVITFSENGPKVSFLTTVSSREINAPPRVEQHPAPNNHVARPGQIASATDNLRRAAPFTLQYEANIRSFNQSSVSVGSNSGEADFVINHGKVLPKHTEFYFSGQSYYIHSLNQSNTTLVNGRFINEDCELRENDTITFREGGPKLRYLGNGRFTEVLESTTQPLEEKSMIGHMPQPDIFGGDSEQSIADRLKSIFKK